MFYNYSNKYQGIEHTTKGAGQVVLGDAFFTHTEIGQSTVTLSVQEDVV